MNSVDADGKQLKMVTLAFDVTGAAGSGRASVSAVIDKDANVNLKNVNVSVAGGKTIAVNVNGKGRQKGQIIDV